MQCMLIPIMRSNMHVDEFERKLLKLFNYFDEFERKLLKLFNYLKYLIEHK